MSSCTIYIRHPDVVACVSELDARAALCGIKINNLARDGTSTQFSGLILGTLNHLKKFTNSPDIARGNVMKHVTETSVLVGVPNAAPGPLVDSMANVARIAAGMDAIFFDGVTMRDHVGKDLMI